jgi:hypothetical protein
MRSETGTHVDVGLAKLINGDDFESGMAWRILQMTEPHHEHSRSLRIEVSKVDLHSKRGYHPISYSALSTTIWYTQSQATSISAAMGQDSSPNSGRRSGVASWGIPTFVGFVVFRRSFPALTNGVTVEPKGRQHANLATNHPCRIVVVLAVTSHSRQGKSGTTPLDKSHL